MVGVPHSTGCSRCRERRIRCDEVTPECSQCRRYGRPCPGYRRTFRFQDEGPSLERRYHSPAGHVPSTPYASSTTSTLEDAARIVRDSALAMIHHYTSMDADYANTDSPTSILLESQHIQCFSEFICNAFSSMYNYHRFRARDGLDFQSYISRHLGAHVFQDAAVACLSSVSLAHFSSNPARLEASRHIYAQSLSEVAQAVQTPLAMSDAMLSTVMMLSVYEMYAQTSNDAWVVHADGVTALMLSRGALSHVQGLARFCYIAYRGFLVAAAICKGKPCFLDQEDWQHLANRVMLEDFRKPTEWPSSIYAAELVSREIVKCPRHFCEARELACLSPSPSRTAAIRNVEQGVQATKGILDQAAADLRDCVSRDLSSYVGAHHDDNPAGHGGLSLLLQGAERALSILDDLLKRFIRALVGPEWSTALSFRVVWEMDQGPPSAPGDRVDSFAVTWPDRVASSMGMIGISIIQD